MKDLLATANLALICDILMEEQAQQAKELRDQRERNERENCIRCGAPIKKHWETAYIESQSELVLSYCCPVCGCEADQHFKLVYDRTIETN